VGRHDLAAAGVKVAYYSPLPPERSGIADYSALLLPALRRLADIEVVRRGRTRPIAADVALYHVGNDPDAHGWIVDALRRRPGVVVLHDFVLHHLVAGLTLGRKNGPAYLAALERDAGIPGRLLAHGVLEGRVSPLWETRPDEFPLVDEVLAQATGVVVHSNYVQARVRERGYEQPIWRIAHPAWPRPDVESAQVDGHPVFGCFGHMNPSKRIPQLLAAFALVRRRYHDARLLLVGPASPGFDMSCLVGDGIERVDYVDEERLWSLMAACDACVSLRAPTMGETSGSAIRALSLGRPLIVSDLGWFSELPDEVAFKVPPNEDEIPALAAALELLAASEATQQAMSDAARAYVEREHAVERVAEEYTAALEEAGGGPAVADAVVREVALAAAEVGVEPGTEFAQELGARLGELGFTQNGRPEPAPRVPSSALVRMPAWGWLALLVLASIFVRWWLAGRIVAPWIMVDELVYSELAKSFAATGHFLIRGQHHGAYGFLYPLMISPAWRLFSSVPTAYAVAKVIGSIAMSLTAIPVYFLARRTLRPLPSLIAAALAVAVPSMLYTGTLMTETLFYPLFACVALVLVLALERPSAIRQLVLIATCLLAFLTRTQSVVLLPAIATAPVVLGIAERRIRRTVLSFRLLYAVLAVAVVAAVIIEVARGHSPYDVLGSYSVTGHAHYRAGAVLRWLLYHVSELDLYLGVVPFAALGLLATMVRMLDRAARIFVVAAVSLSAWLVLEVATFASALSLRVEERNMFYVAPLFFTALILWIERGLPRPGRATALCAAVAAALPAVLPFDRLIDTPAESDTLALLPLWWLQEHLITLSEVSLLVAAAAVLLACLFVATPARLAYTLVALVLAWLVFANERVEDFDHGFPHAAAGGLATGLTLKPRNWIDRRVGSNAEVAFVWPGPTLNANALWENEFFNRGIRKVYDLGPPSPGDLPESSLHAQPDGTLAANGRAVEVKYVVTDRRSHIAGTVIGRDSRIGTVLLATDGTLRLAYLVTGLYPRDVWSGSTLSYTQFQCSGGTLAVTLGSDGTLFSKPQTVTGVSGSKSVSVSFAPTTTATLRLPLAAGVDGTCQATFNVRPTAVPAVVEHGSTDTRVLGARFLAFRYTPR
jgi:glycosyltransferase involved in cell wall biosynthesis